MEGELKGDPLGIAIIAVPVLALGLLGVLGVIALTRTKVVTVALKNPPVDAENWSLALTDWEVTAPIHEISGKDMLDIAEAATFEIPPSLDSPFPLRVISLQITKWNEARTALIVLYEVQSFHPPDPSYREVFILDKFPEDYFYNVATEIFE